MDTSAKTLGQLKATGWQPKSVKEEIRNNLMTALKNKDTLFEGIKGYEKTVIPQLQHALLSRHDFILLGLRGQAKTRLIRMIPQLLDPFMPVVEGSELMDDPFAPISPFAKNLVAERGDETPITWVPRQHRFAEKLATPDTSVADLIGDVDPIKAATEKRTLADELVINYGLIPRMNRGVFAINELPDLQPRIQVALLNIMQERDIQIRGFNIRIPLDVLMVFTANPEDYTNRGNIITPLKDRIDSQIITHYPKSIDVGVEITGQEAWVSRNGSATNIPYFVREIVEQVAFEARKSEFVDQKSGVSARMSITAMEQLVSAAERRSILTGEPVSVRISDLYHMVPALTGKLELVYEGEQEGAVNVAKVLIGKAVNTIFKKYFPDPQNRKQSGAAFQSVLQWFGKGGKVELADDLPQAAYQQRLAAVDGLEDLVRKQVKPSAASEAFIFMDFVLDALHQNSMLGREDLDLNMTYSDMVGSMLGSLGKFGDDDADDNDDPAQYF
ncbi:magnesium chelatase subunit I [Cyclonatronum proteinivorum]|uniref:Magnesium chelatase subunit I n=1 Tax=Cyclonatronum proteinivorum TaxID=1457365 RepID=A0A345UK17_9BACT|nr:sigma 54-interacting transcriptional regulator [Cyclonatronum proteinivorum]AXJ00819.1 magnesium chelatase subunit I [Cyclonatronum proteinivorum]